MKNKVTVQIVDFNKQTGKNTYKIKSYAIETFEEKFAELSKTKEIREIIKDYKTPVKLYIDYEYEDKKENLTWG